LFRALNVYFTSNKRLISGQLPYEVPVKRFAPSSKNVIIAVLDEIFKGPSDVERNQGLAVIHNGFTGYKNVIFANGGVYVYLAGSCQSNGTLYTIAQPLMANLKQFRELQFVKIYDQAGNTLQPAARVDSVPGCIDPLFTPSPTPLPTSTLRPTRTPTPLWTARPFFTKTPTKIFGPPAP
jgi:hypothetical protein